MHASYLLLSPPQRFLRIIFATNQRLPTSRVVKDYDKYIARQLRRGTTRQELNVSWLKANELEVKRTVAELRDTIKSNWSTTGQELAREIRGFWQNATPASLSRPASPARAGREMPSTASPAPGRTPLVGRSLDIPRSGATASPAPGGREAGSADFAAGYSLGLMGGVRAWVSFVLRLFWCLIAFSFLHSSHFPPSSSG